MTINSRGGGNDAGKKAGELFFQNLLNSVPAKKLSHERVLREIAAGKRVTEYHLSIPDLPRELDTPLVERKFAKDAKGNTHLPVRHDEIEFLLGKGFLVRKARTDKNRLVWPIGLHQKQENFIKKHFKA